MTPNIPEAEVLTDTLIRDQEDMEAAAHRLVERYGCAALVKGGHGTEDANDVLAETDGTVTWFDGVRINNPNTHGTGCTLSSAIASYLALGDTIAQGHQACEEVSDRCTEGPAESWPRLRPDGSFLEVSLSPTGSPL